MKKQPVLFLGHGSPLNVISENEWTKKISAYGKSLERPDGIVVISAHWLTEGVRIHASPHPKTIHDFRGFPDALYKIQYRAPSSDVLAQKLLNLLPEARLTEEWGFDHGTWGVLNFLRPQADVPVLPISLNAQSKPQEFYDLGQKLKSLKEQNILIIGSGNVVHNLREIDFDPNAENFSWAEEFDQKVKDLTSSGENQKLIGWSQSENKKFLQAHPTSEHWAPYIVCLGAADEISQVNWVYEGLQNGSISMRSAEWQ